MIDYLLSDYLFVGIFVFWALLVLRWLLIKKRPSKAGMSSYEPAKGLQPTMSKEEIKKERLATLQKVLRTYYQNLNELEERAAQYGLNVPIEITNQIGYFEEKIEKVEKEIAALARQ